MISVSSRTKEKYYLFQWDNAYKALDIVFELGDTKLKISAELHPSNTDIRTKRCNLYDLKMIPIKLENLHQLSDESKKFIYNNTCSVLNEAVKKEYIHSDSGKDYLRFTSNYLTENGINDDNWFPFPG